LIDDWNESERGRGVVNRRGLATRIEKERYIGELIGAIGDGNEEAAGKVVANQGY